MIPTTLIFDFDGTIGDTLEEGRVIYNQIAHDYKLREIGQDEVEQLRDYSLRELVAHLKIPKRFIAIFLARGTKQMGKNIDQLRVISGLKEVLPELRAQSTRFGILTSNSVANVDLFLRAQGIRELFDFISSTSKLSGKAKYLKAIRKTFSLEAGEMLYIGDEVRDIKAAHRAQIPIAAVTWGFNSRKALFAENPKYLFESPSELLQIFTLLPGTAE